MSASSLPRRAEDCWQGHFVLDPAQPVVAVSAGTGIAIAGGQSLHMLRPGAEAWKMRPPPGDVGPVIAVAAEQVSPWRHAYAGPGGVVLFLQRDQVLTLRSETPHIQVTHMAWARLGKDNVLYLRWDNGQVGRVRLDLKTIEHMEIEPMDALASDANGTLAMISIRGNVDDTGVWTTSDGAEIVDRPVTTLLGDDDGAAHVHLAVAGTAIAYAVDGWGVHLSRSEEEDFDVCAEGMRGGPLAFQGADADAALFTAYRNEEECAILRLDRDGTAQRIAEVETKGREAPRVTALAWDASRRVLWAASPDVGLMKSIEPRGKGGREKAMLS